MGNFAKQKVGSTAGIFDGLDFPQTVSGREFKSPEEYYMWEHGWHTLEQYVTAYHRLRSLFGANTYADCGATVARFQSWGILEDTKYVIGGVAGALEKVPQLNESFNDTKDFIIAKAPLRKGSKVQCTYIIRPHDDIDPHKDYPSDPHILGILRQIPVVFGLAPANVTQSLVPYDLERLCNEEPEFRDLDLDPRIEGDILSIRDPLTQEKRALARRVRLLSESIHLQQLGDDTLFLGNYREPSQGLNEVFRLDGALTTKDTMLFADGTILGAPYFVINFESEREGGTLRSFYNSILFKLKKDKATRESLLDAISQIAQENKEKAAAYEQLKRQYAHERKLERLMTGGFAHEIRNKLAPALYETKQLENDHTLTSMKDDLTAIMRSFVDLEKQYGVPRSVIISEFVPRMRTLATYADRMEVLVRNVTNDVGLALRVTDQIRNYAKMQELQRGSDTVDVSILAQSYGARYGAKLADNDINYHVTSTGDTTLTADQNHIDSILENLVKNAFEAVEHSAEKKVEVALSNIEKRGNHYLRIEVSDSGEGIAPEHLPNIFYPFYSTKPDIGTGLGLSVANKLVELYQGSIEATSQPGKTTFTVDLWMNSTH
jgi:signal transduction histidine kinase